jgi:hypothetical protein
MVVAIVRERYVVRETHGYRTPGKGHTAMPPQASVFICDRLDAWRVVRTWRSEESGFVRLADGSLQGGRLGIEGARARATAYCEYLNRTEES